MWTGDNQAMNQFLGLSVQMCLTLGVSGVPFCGADIGGFTGYIPPEHLAGWYIYAAFQPFMRAHGHDSTRHREPWLQGEYLEYIQQVLIMRYQLLPYM